MTLIHGAPDLQAVVSNWTTNLENILGKHEVGLCLACQPGSFKPTMGDAGCSTCPANSTSPAGSTAETDCIRVPGTEDILEENSPFLVAKTESWSPSRQEFTDESGNGRVGRLMQGDVRVGLDDGHGASIDIPLVERSADTVIQWNGPFTICSVTRYSSAFRGRLLQCQDSNWLHGHHSDKAGVMHYDARNGGSSQPASVSSSSDWKVTCGRNVVSSGSVSTIVNRVSQSTGGGTPGAGNCALGINNNYADEHSDWQLSKLYVWDYHLSDSMLSSANCCKMDNSDGNDQNNTLAHSASPKTIYVFAVLGLLVALLLMTVDAIKWMGLPHGVLEWNGAKAGAYKAKSNFALVLLILISQVGTVQPEPRYECSSQSDCDFLGCNDVPCSSSSQGCVNGIWTNWGCYKYNRYTSQSCADGGCGCFYGEYDSIQLYTGVCPGPPCPNGTYGLLGDGFQAWGSDGWQPPSTCTPCEEGKAPSFPLLTPSLPPLPHAARVPEAGCAHPASGTRAA